jgi:hypothetical protein
MTIQEIREELIEEQEQNRRLKTLLRLSRNKVALLTRIGKKAKQRAKEAESAIAVLASKDPIPLSRENDKYYLEIKIPKTEITKEQYESLLPFFMSIAVEDEQ